MKYQLHHHKEGERFWISGIIKAAEGSWIFNKIFKYMREAADENVQSDFSDMFYEF